MYMWITGFVICGILTVASYTYSVDSKLSDDRGKYATKEEVVKLDDKVD